MQLAGGYRGEFIVQFRGTRFSLFMQAILAQLRDMVFVLLISIAGWNRLMLPKDPPTVKGLGRL